jgi:hypothetical protein
MLGALAASKAAKAAALCVCPIVGSAAITLSVPKVRDAVHRVTAPKQLAMASSNKPRQYAKSRVRPAGTQTALNCPDPAPTMLGQSVAPYITVPGATLPDTPGGQSALSNLGGPAPAPAVASSAPANFLPATNLVFPGVGGGVAVPATVTGTTPQPPVALVPLPETETWIQMITGFAAIGGTIRMSKRSAQAVKKPVA